MQTRGKNPHVMDKHAHIQQLHAVGEIGSSRPNAMNLPIGVSPVRSRAHVMPCTVMRNLHQ